ncbi:hypothetical protein K438DRAFT_1978454 [Mycena galopus ATCC 62051]|nr:hypothetical protein K438DRAFT_1978454 [Mycena galopus ATCC 62051]
MNEEDTIFFKRLMNTWLTYQEGDTLFQVGHFAAAKAIYLREAFKLIGISSILPVTSGAQGGYGVQSKVYIELNPLEQTNLMGCCLGMAKCLQKEDDLEMVMLSTSVASASIHAWKALAWCEEINSVLRSTYHLTEHPNYDWQTWTLDIPEMTFVKSAGLCLASEIFASLRNSATAATRRWVATSSVSQIYEPHHTPALKSLLAMRLAIKLMRYRHPDPQATLAAAVTVPSLQLRGSWSRLQVKNLGGFTEGRQSFASIIWRSKLYIAGGRKSEKGPYYRDMWTLDLIKLDAWRQLEDYPIPAKASGNFLGWNLVLYNDTALLFTGRPTIDVFDLKTELSFDSATQVIGDKLYVFGGGHGTTVMGCNLFMELDLLTRKWRRLSGTVHVTEHGDYTCPGPRKNAASWVGPDKAHFYLLFGVVDRDEAYRNNELHGESVVFNCSDFWRWSVKDEVWIQERLAGNPPCARTEMACSYNEKLEQTIVFGGYCPNLQAFIRQENGQEGLFPYSYVADTFIYDMAPSPSPSLFTPTRTAPKWKQVLTPGFPTYRCQAHLAYDPDTGRTYMFGGWTNSQYIPTRSKLLAKTFGDLWELRLDGPGGHWEEVDAEEEVRVARAGPWQRCFSCAAAGPWKKCGGSCKGRVFFCGTVCLREGWKEHKQMHECRKA